MPGLLKRLNTVGVGQYQELTSIIDDGIALAEKSGSAFDEHKKLLQKIQRASTRAERSPRTIDDWNRTLRSLRSCFERFTRQTAAVKPAVAAITAPGQKIFLVHGRDNEMRAVVARFLERGGIVPIILKEALKQGATVSEKFETLALQTHAIVLMSGDDEGRLSKPGEQLKPRVRQNVLFEYGWAIGKLGRARVIVLVKDKPELPSDLDGWLHISFDEAGGWKSELFTELEGSGYAVSSDALRG